MSTSTRGCNNCSFSAKKDAFWCEARGAQERSDGGGWVAMQCNVKRGGSWRIAERVVVRVPRVGSNGDGSLRSDSNVI